MGFWTAGGGKGKECVPAQETFIEIQVLVLFKKSDHLKS